MVFTFIKSFVQSSSPSAPKAAYTYIPFQDAKPENTIVVDCTHPSCKTITHHKSHNNPVELQPLADTSTGLVINALHALQSDRTSALQQCMSMPYVAVNHFDGDGLFSAWAYINRSLALKHEELLIAAASLHDFREVPHSVTNNPELFDTALKLCCWINTIEREKFCLPFDGGINKDADMKYEYFLKELESFIDDPSAYSSMWQDDYNLVLRDIASIGHNTITTDSITTNNDNVHLYPEISLAVIRCPSPVHYYALFHNTHGYDVVLSLYDNNHYELEEKYTQFVCVHSRAVQARLDMVQLAKTLNTIDKNREESCTWNTPRFVDTGPLLRLDHGGKQLTKLERYGHPYNRPMYQSGLSKDEMEEIVVSYFRYGLKGVEGKKGGWSWDELHELNNSIDWDAWRKESGYV